MSCHTKVGKIGEDIAKKYLKKQGYKIIEQNYKTKFAEIDLITKKDNQLIFVEVRTKTGLDFGRPEQTIRRKKLRKLKRNVAHYLKYNNCNGSYRIDAIGVILDKNRNKKQLRHFKNITI